MAVFTSSVTGPQPSTGLRPVEIRGLIDPLSPTSVLSLSCPWAAGPGTRWLSKCWAVAPIRSESAPWRSVFQESLSPSPAL